MECNFTLEHYKEILEKALEMGYDFLTMRQASWTHKDYDKIVCLRHDADYFRDVVNSLNFSNIEDELGIKASYFFRLHADYNIFTPENYKVIKQLRDHEVGLHYEGDFARMVGEHPILMLKRELDAMEYIINRNVIGMAYHCPGRAGYALTPEQIGRSGVVYEAYDDVFTKHMKYISDSYGWREGCLCEWLGKEDKIVALFHQIHWYNESPIETF